MFNRKTDSDRYKNISVSDEDLNLIPPFCYLSRPFNRLLGTLLGSLYYCRWLLLPVFLFAMFIALVLFPEDWLPVLLMPLMVLLYGVLIYAGIGMVLLAFLARHPGTRVTFALIILVMALEFFLLSLADSRLFLSFRSSPHSWLAVLSLIVLVFSALHFGRYLLPYARGCTLALLLVLALTSYESGWLPGALYRYTTIAASDIRVENCFGVRRWVKSLRREVYTRYCDLDFQLNGRPLQLYRVPMPGPELAYLEVRYGLFNHFQTRDSDHPRP